MRGKIKIVDATLLDLSKENSHRDDYIKALKRADDEEYGNLIELQANTL
jgi:hypothetical protein